MSADAARVDDARGLAAINAQISAAKVELDALEARVERVRARLQDLYVERWEIRTAPDQWEPA